VAIRSIPPDPEISRFRVFLQFWDRKGADSFQTKFDFNRPLLITLISTMNKDQKVSALFEQFGKGTDLTKSVIGNILDAENGDYDSTVDILLNMTNDVTGIKPKQAQGN
jgi:hypothetical protein